MSSEIDLIAATLNIPVPESFVPTDVTPQPLNPGDIYSFFPPESEFYAEFNDLYDVAEKAWRDKRPHSVEAEEAVREAEEQIAAYQQYFAIWQEQVYNLQREVQWRMLCANALVDAGGDDPDISAAYGEMYDDAGATIVTIVTSGTFYKWLPPFSGQHQLTSIDLTHGTITISDGGGGIYVVNASISMEATTNSLVTAAIFKNGVRVIGGTSRHKTPSGSDFGFIGISCSLDLSPGDVVDLRFTSDGDGDTVQPANANLFIHRIKTINP